MNVCTAGTMWLWVHIVLIVITFYVKHVYNYWERKGFTALKPSIPFGSLGPVVKQTQSMGEVMRDIHLMSKEPYLGINLFFRPALLIRDATLVKRILITDFDHFHDRGLHYDESADPISANLFAMPGQQWKDLRAKLSPTFTSGKLKNMFQPIVDKTQLLKDHLIKLTETQDDVHLKSELIRLNQSIIASTFFGFELNAFAEPDHEFSKMGDLFFDSTKLRNKITMVGFMLFPTVLKWLRIPVVDPTVSKYIMNLMHTVIDARTADPSLIRKDFIQTVMELMKDAGKNEKVKLTVESCAAQAFLFYTAGYETSAATTSYCMYELSKNPEWLDKARAEVDTMMKKQNGQIQYEDQNEFKVLDMCIKETMRKYPAVPFLNRECTMDYTIPGTDQVVPRGTAIILPIFGLHTDPEHFTDPEKFDPSRFEKDNPDLPYYPVGNKFNYFDV